MPGPVDVALGDRLAADRAVPWDRDITPAGVVHASSTAPVPDKQEARWATGWATPPEAAGRSHRVSQRIARGAANGTRTSVHPWGLWNRPVERAPIASGGSLTSDGGSRSGWQVNENDVDDMASRHSRRTVCRNRNCRSRSGRGPLASSRLSRSRGAVSPGTPRWLRGLLACLAAAGSWRSRPRSPSSSAPAPHS